MGERTGNQELVILIETADVFLLRTTYIRNDRETYLLLTQSGTWWIMLHMIYCDYEQYIRQTKEYVILCTK